MKLVKEKQRNKSLQTPESLANDKPEVSSTNAPSRSLRSSGTLTYSSVDGLENGSETGSSNGKSVKEKKKKSNSQVDVFSTLKQTLSDNSMRSDFLEIVRDLQVRADDFEKSKPKVFMDSS